MSIKLVKQQAKSIQKEFSSGRNLEKKLFKLKLFSALIAKPYFHLL